MSREAMKLALEAFEAIPEEVEGWIPSKCTDAIIALKQALEQPEPEPVAVVSGYYGGKCVVLPTDPARIFNSGTAFYTHPPKREWQGLMDWEINSVANNNNPLDGIRSFARAVEAKLKEKNT